MKKFGFDTWAPDRADFLLVLGLLLFAALYVERASHITVGFASDVLGPAFFPRLLAFLLALLAVGLLARSLTGRGPRVSRTPMRSRLFWTVVALLVGYALLMPLVGFLYLTPLLLGAVMRILGLERWGWLVGVALGLTVFLYVLFTKALSVPLPPGLLGER